MPSNMFDTIAGANGSSVQAANYTPTTKIPTRDGFGLPTPMTWTGTGYKTFTLNASATNQVSYWNGTALIELKSPLSYTWATTATNTILNSDGEIVANQSPSLGLWYYYIAAIDGYLMLLPSKTAPVHTNNVKFAHNGKKRGDVEWIACGYHFCTNAGTATFDKWIKQGQTVYFTAVTYTLTTSNALATFLSGGENVLPAIPVFARASAKAAASNPVIIGIDSDASPVGANTVDGAVTASLLQQTVGTLRGFYAYVSGTVTSQTLSVNGFIDVL